MAVVRPTGLAVPSGLLIVACVGPLALPDGWACASLWAVRVVHILVCCFLFYHFARISSISVQFMICQPARHICLVRPSGHAAKHMYSSRGAPCAGRLGLRRAPLLYVLRLLNVVLACFSTNQVIWLGLRLHAGFL